MGDVGEVFVVDWEFSIERVSGKGEIRYWPSSYIGAGDTGTWGYEGFVANLALWMLWSRCGHIPPFSLLHLPQASYC